MSLVVGQRMIRTDDGMKGAVELVQVPGFEDEFERRIVYLDRGEKRVAPKREAWEPEKAPPRRLTLSDIELVAWAADVELEAIEKNHLTRRWEKPDRRGGVYDLGLCDLIREYLAKRGG
jgi:hypothetical protein